MQDIGEWYELSLQWFHTEFAAVCNKHKKMDTHTHGILLSFQKIDSSNICNMLTDRTLGLQEKSYNKVLN